MISKNKINEEAEQCLTVDDWIKQQWLHLYMEYYLALKNKKITLCHSRDGPEEYYAKWKNLVRETLVLYD